ncbi:MAG: hypothetical protein IAF38_14140 [Bacteroidia bacterium]|nr:hypothetical protein [Bacteroidia bacterium]
MKKSFHIFLFTLCSSLFVKSQVKASDKHVFWKTYYEPSKENLNEGSIVFEAVVDSGFQMFARNQMPQLPVGIEIAIKKSKDFELKGELIAPLPAISFSHTYKMPVAVYKGKVQFRQKIVLKTKKEFVLNATVENEETSNTEKVVFYKNDVVVSVRPQKGVRLKFL